MKHDFRPHRAHPAVCDKCGRERYYETHWVISLEQRLAALPASLSLWIYLPQMGAWECHRNGSTEIRDYLRAVWRDAGHATAVER